MTQELGTSGGGPLAGIRILDLTRVLAGPYSTMILSDLGAEVVKVERPGTGDESRQFLPFIDGESAYFAAANRGKKSIALDLTVPDDRAIFDRLLAQADVLVENFRPGVMEKLGCGWDALHARFPKLVFASISGFGQTGPYRTRGAYDLIVQAMGGMMSITGFPGMPPVRPGTSLGDLAAGVFAANGIQAALLQRYRTGMGSRVDVSMLECQIALLENALARHAATGETPAPMGARHPGAAPFDAFRAQDGYLVITAGADGLFKSFATALELPSLLTDERFANRKSRVANHAELKQLIESRLAGAPVAHWLKVLDGVGVPAGPVNDIPAVLADPQVVSRGILAPIKNGAATLRLPTTPILISGHPYPAELPPVPGLDEHRAEILRSLGDAA